MLVRLRDYLASWFDWIYLPRIGVLDVVEIIMSLEEAFGINIEEEDCEKFHTVGDVYDFMVRRKICDAPVK